MTGKKSPGENLEGPKKVASPLTPVPKRGAKKMGVSAGGVYYDDPSVLTREFFSLGRR